jgi:hypothetical protein
MRLLNKTILAKDIPGWAIKAFESIDYDNMNAFTRTSLLASLRMWCSTQPQRQRQYFAEERMTPIPPELASVINLIDFDRMTRESMMTAKSFLTESLFSFAPKYKD